MDVLLVKNPRLKLPFIEAPGLPSPEVYYPLEEAPGISREFTAIRSPDDALAFANKYGLLGLKDGEDGSWEDANDWIGRANELRQIYEVWDLLAKADTKGLRDIVIANKHGVPIIRPRALKLQRPTWAAPAPRQLKPENIISLANGFIAERYNLKMVNMASPMLLIDAKGALHAYNRPSSLLGALWLEFGEVAAGSRKQAPCENCGTWMDVTGKRSDKRKCQTCINRDKTARYRAKAKILPVFTMGDTVGNSTKNRG